MTKFCTIVSLILLTCCIGSSKANFNGSSGTVADSSLTDTIPEGARKLIASYPLQGMTYSNNRICFPDSTYIIYDDGRDKDFITKLDYCDIEDMFSMEYVKDNTPPDYLSDCGRGRSEQLYKKMYGSSESAVKRNLVRVEWFGMKIPFTSVNDANKHLEDVAKELELRKDLRKYLTNASTFYWRKVRGANRQSAHSYGIAIDINTKYSNYWLWSNPKCSETDTLKYENRIPLEIVDVFEKHGFIWGGRWYHYDTMHFEYRPELLKE